MGGVGRLKQSGHKPPPNPRPGGGTGVKGPHHGAKGPMAVRGPYMHVGVKKL